MAYNDIPVALGDVLNGLGVSPSAQWSPAGQAVKIFVDVISPSNYVAVLTTRAMIDSGV